MCTHISSVKLQWLLYNFNLPKWNVSHTTKLFHMIWILFFCYLIHKLLQIICKTILVWQWIWLKWVFWTEFCPLYVVVVVVVNFLHSRFSIQSHRPNFIKTWRKHPWVKGIQVCSNEGLCRFPKGAYYTLPRYADIFFQNNKANFHKTYVFLKSPLGEENSSLFK